MNQIHYFAHKDEYHYVAVVPGLCIEMVYFWSFQELGSTRIEFKKTGLAETYPYESETSKYSPCRREEYLAARAVAQSSIAEFFGNEPQFQTSPVKINPTLMSGFLAQVRKPGLFVTLPTGREISNDLPF